MKVKIDNKIIKVKIINANYNENSKEIELLEGTFKGKYAIVNNKDFIIEKKYFRYYVQETQAPDIGEKWKTVTIKKCETLEDAKKIKAKFEKANHCNIYSHRILDRLEKKYL